MLEQLKSGFKRTIMLNKYQSKISTERQNQNLDFLMDSSLQGVNRLFVLLFENEGNRIVHIGYYLPKVEIKDYKVLIDGQNFFDQPAYSDMRTYDKIQKNGTGQGDGYKTGCLLDNPYFKEHYKLIAVGLSKQ